MSISQILPSLLSGSTKLSTPRLTIYMLSRPGCTGGPDRLQLTCAPNPNTKYHMRLEACRSCFDPNECIRIRGAYQKKRSVVGIEPDALRGH